MKQKDRRIQRHEKRIVTLEGAIRSYGLVVPVSVARLERARPIRYSLA